MAFTIAARASSSSVPSQMSSISSPFLMQAPRTLRTLLALAVVVLCWKCDLTVKLHRRVAEDAGRAQMESRWITDDYLLAYHNT